MIQLLSVLSSGDFSNSDRWKEAAGKTDRANSKNVTSRNSAKDWLLNRAHDRTCSRKSVCEDRTVVFVRAVNFAGTLTPRALSAGFAFSGKHRFTLLLSQRVLLPGQAKRSPRKGAVWQASACPPSNVASSQRAWATLPQISLPSRNIEMPGVNFGEFLNQALSIATSIVRLRTHFDCSRAGAVGIHLALHHARQAYSTRFRIRLLQTVGNLSASRSPNRNQQCCLEVC